MVEVLETPSTVETWAMAAVAANDENDNTTEGEGNGSGTDE